MSQTADGLIDSWNSGAEHLFGYSDDEILGLRIDVLFGTDRLIEEQRRMRQIEKANHVERFESVCRHKDGQSIDAAVAVSAITDAQGQITGFATIIRDLSGLRQAEEQSRIARRETDALFKDSPLPMWLYDVATLRFLAVNDTAVRQYGYSREEFLMMSLHDIRPEELPTASRAKLLKPLDRFETSGSWTHLTKDRTPIEVEITSCEFRFSECNARLVVAHDVTARNLAEDEIRRINADLDQRVIERTNRLETAMRELEAFSYSISHDLRAPLRAIDGFGQRLLENHSAALDTQGLRLLTTIRNETHRMSQQIDDLLAFSRTSRQDLENGEINMTDLAQCAAQQITEAGTEPRPPIAIHPLPWASGDRAMVRQVFANLLENAVKFSRGKSTPLIEVSGQRDGDWNTYCVKDNGVGFDERYAKRLFGVFQRLHSQAEFEGTGVGLALVQRIIHRHGGKIWAVGKVGHGATFHFALRNCSNSD